MRASAFQEDSNNNQEKDILIFCLLHQILMSCRNTYLQYFLNIKEYVEQNNLNLSDLSIEIHSTERPADGHHQGRFHRPTAPEISLLLPNEIPQNAKRTIICSMRQQSRQYNLREFQDYHRSYDPLQYPLLFPYSKDGWHMDFHNLTGSKVTANAYTRYKIYNSYS